MGMGKGLFRLGWVWMLAVCALGANAADEGYTPLFNGKDLTGWSGDPKLWSVKDGAIVGSTDGVKIEHNTFLSHEKKFADFILRAKVKLRNHNSGIQFRSEQHPDYVVAGYQADVAEQTYFGLLYEEKKRGILPYWNEKTQEERDAIQALVHKGDWNDYEIRCEGDHVVMTLNGTVVCDLIDPEGAKEGIIALQLHAGPEMQVAYKDIEIMELPKKDNALVLPDFDATRSERLEVAGAKIRVPQGFSVEEVATHELIGSVINMTFDHLGRPVVAAEGQGIRILLDENNDGVYDAQKSFTERVSTAMGLCFIAPGDLLVQARIAKGDPLVATMGGEEVSGLYRLRDTNGDDEADEVTLLVPSNGGMGEHGPHAINIGPDGSYYIIYGNHAHPAKELDPESPLRNTQEDHLLPLYVDPRGHATTIKAPGGTIHRLSPDFKSMSQLLGGFRNAYDFSMDAMGEMFTFDSDMEWDIGQPWFRPVRVIHAVPSADYGWRTGSSKMPPYYIDTLPAMDDVGRGSPVGTVIYDHHVYPGAFRGAFFMGDWSRGRIRVVFPKRAGATYEGKAQDFVLGEPLNVTDVDVAPDGFLYYTVGGRQTHGGLFRVRYNGAATGLHGAGVSQPMPRSAWGRYAIEQDKAKQGDAWGGNLAAFAKNTQTDGALRARALELLHVHNAGTKEDRIELLTAAAADPSAEVRAMAVFLLGAYDSESVKPALISALKDSDPFVARRACDAIMRVGAETGAVDPLMALMNHEDRFLRYAARQTLARAPREAWASAVLNAAEPDKQQFLLEGLLALIHTAQTPADFDAIFAKLESLASTTMSDPARLDYLRLIQLAFLRDASQAPRDSFKQAVGTALLATFPASGVNVNRELQVVLAHMQTPGAAEKMLAYLTPDKSQQEQIHTVYCLRAIKSGWTREQRDQLVAWFDRGRTMTGGASFEGFINNLWNSSLELLPEDEKQLAEARKAEALQKQAEANIALMAALENEAPAGRTDLAQMSYDEMAEYLEYDPMAYRNPNLEKGQRVFMRARCMNCHVFGTIGKGGGPDLSTVVSRFRRRDILEAIMYPSKVVSDQYTGVELDLDDFSTVTGMVLTENDDTLTVITVDGVRQDIPKKSIAERRAATQSVMPEGLLNTMSMDDLVSLVNFLEKGADMPPAQTAAK
ncbi:MAG: hypothetical protein AMXMBFR84_07100 [Candidatus Hydrogenedentota bacterium]